MQRKHLGIGVLIAFALVVLAGSAAAHGGTTTAPVGDTPVPVGDTPIPINDTQFPVDGNGDDWAVWMTNHMGPDHVEWMETRMGMTIDEMGAYMAANGGPRGVGMGGGGCH